MKFRYPILLLLSAIFLSCTSEGFPPDPLPHESGNEPLKILALGDSYTIGESVAEGWRWPVQLGAKLEENGISVDTVKIIARTGWTTTNLIDAIESRNPGSNHDLVGLLIGVNNEYQGRPIQEYEQEFQQLLQTAIDLAEGKKEQVFVVSIPDYGFTPFGAPNQSSISARIDEFNARNRFITGQYGIRYIDITDISREGLGTPELVATDGLHPSGYQYQRWVEERILPGVLEMIR